MQKYIFMLLKLLGLNHALLSIPRLRQEIEAVKETDISNVMEVDF